MKKSENFHLILKHRSMKMSSTLSSCVLRRDKKYFCSSFLRKCVKPSHLDHMDDIFENNLDKKLDRFGK
jgi:hypothetical protein